MQPASSSSRRIAVIGAGLCGLAAVRSLLEVGLEPVCFECTSGIGGLWTFDEALPDGGTVAYRSLRTNTSKLVTAFSDFPFPDDYPDFPTRAQFLDYLFTYADHFDLLPHIRFLTQVESVLPAQGGGWCVLVRSLSGKAVATEERFDAVMVCTGFNSKPSIPDFPGLESFRGQLLHSASYKGPEAFAGKRVVVVGASSSASDVAVELSCAAPGLLLSVRRGTWITPRYIDGRPADLRVSRFVSRLPMKLRQRNIQRLILDEYTRLGIAPGKYLPLPEFDFNRVRLTPGIELLQQLQAGAIVAKPAIERLEGGEVVFVDGTRAAADAIIAATGYHIRLPFVDPSVVEVTGDTMWLYRHVFPPDRPGLAFIGFCTVGAPVPPTIEMQCRWVAAIFAGRLRLPPVDSMQASLDQRRAECAGGLTHPMKLKMPSYLEELAGEVGAQPKLWRHPTLLPQLLFGPLIAAHYRLDGPGRSDVAKKMIMKSAMSERHPLPAILPTILPRSSQAGSKIEDRGRGTGG
jgi:dimethylaniline monooxygenase (N-oxide forming)